MVHYQSLKANRSKQSPFLIKISCLLMNKQLLLNKLPMLLMNNYVSILNQLSDYLVILEKKLFGDISVNDVVKSSTKLDSAEFGLKGYRFPNDRVYHGFNNNHMVP